MRHAFESRRTSVILGVLNYCLSLYVRLRRRGGLAWTALPRLARQAKPILIAPGQIMEQWAEGFTGIDIAKACNAIAVAVCERGAKVRYSARSTPPT
jgi:hypothetical protein